MYIIQILHRLKLKIRIFSTPDGFQSVTVLDSETSFGKPSVLVLLSKISLEK